jgi:glycosyltransferase involved in cell wall biosynthesis
MRSVVDGYLADGLFSRWRVVLLNSHVEGGLALRLTTAAREFLRLVALLLSRRVGLVHCHAAMKGSFWRKSAFALISRIAGVPVVFHLHGGVMKAFVARQPVVVQRLIGWVLARQSAVVVLSDGWREYVKSISPLAAIEVLPNYVSLPAATDPAVRDGGTGITVLFLGLVGVGKGVYDLLPAFKEAVAEVPGLHLILAGNGEVDRARALAVELGIQDRVEFAGWVAGEKKVELFQRAHIYVLPSHFEGLPVSLLEAMSWQLPVISTRVGAIPEVVRQGVDGLLLDAGDRVALASAIVELARSDALRRRMGVAARQRIEHGYSKEVVLPRLEALYGELMLDGSTGRIGKS